jgi:hypothetical protein
VTAACLVVRRQVFEQVQGFNAREHDPQHADGASQM